MSKGGELEKRLKQYFTYDFRVDENIMNERNYFNLGGVMGIIDEAKREFPIRVVHPPHCSLKREKNINYWRNKILRMEKWFEKWFGE